MSRSVADWEAHYTEGSLPWDTGTTDPELARAVGEGSIAPCRTLEVGCGTGTNAIWLAQQGFEVVATDLAPTAIARAAQKASVAGVKLRLIEGSFPDDEAAFQFVFDRGCFHSIDEPEARAAFAKRVAAQLGPEGLASSGIGRTLLPVRVTVLLRTSRAPTPPARAPSGARRPPPRRDR